MILITQLAQVAKINFQCTAGLTSCEWHMYHEALKPILTSLCNTFMQLERKIAMACELKDVPSYTKTLNLWNS